MDGMMEFRGFGSLADLLKRIANSHREDERPKKPLFKLSAEEISKFALIEARAKALEEQVRTVQSQIRSDRDRIWADLKDKYKLHGKDVWYDDETGSILEIVNEERLTNQQPSEED